jgi:hypothetical protein
MLLDEIAAREARQQAKDPALANRVMVNRLG